MAPVSEEQKALFEQIAWKVADVLLLRIDEKLAAHIQTCPHGRRMAKFFWIAIGIASGVGLAGFGSGFWMAKILTAI